jgi:hypothetical protein
VTPDPVEVDYQSRLSNRRARLAALERRHVLFSRVRLAMLVLGVVALITARPEVIVWVGVLVVAFVGVMVVHARTITDRDRAGRSVKWYEGGLERINHTWVGRGDGGDRFRPDGHLYADDLDIFGKGSLYELLSTPRTPPGQALLAAWLLSPAAPATVRERQEAVQELAARPDLREALAIVGEAPKVRESALRAWTTAGVVLRGLAIPIALGVLSATNITLLVYFLRTGRLGALSLGLMLIQMLVAALLAPRVRAVTGAIDQPTQDLAVLAGVLRVLEPARFKAPALQRLSSAIAATGRPASAEIAHLDRLASRLTWRLNMMFAIPAALMLWTTQCAFAIDRWRARVGPRVAGWLDAVAEFEALSALATFAAEHPAASYPVLDDQPARLDATALAHPLLGRDAVANDVALGGSHPALLVVSGSNMSGKSTFLRALGVNVVLAHAGGPVRATRFQLSALQIGASIRVLDSLQDGRSRFFAEITRLKQIVDLTRRYPGGVLFLLDEILAGTNSHDRAHGAGALFDGLLGAGAIGLATTHDLALSELADARRPRAGNVHFADRFDAGGLAFDYHLRPGPVKTSNALVLMKSIGLEV